MNRPIKNAIQIMKVLAPRPSWNNRATGALVIIASFGITKLSRTLTCTSGAIFFSTLTSLSARCFWTRNASESGMVHRMKGISNIGVPATKNTDCQP
ncbi:hypothetical protein D3C72_2342230 [compost metagenome]